MSRRSQVSRWTALALAIGAAFLAPVAPCARAEPEGDDRLLVEASFSTLPAPPAGAGPEVVTLTLVGDTGFNGDRQPVNQDGALRHGQLHPWADIFSRIRGEISGDLVFANLESVVTPNNALRSEDKIFAFRSHPEGVRALAALGFNLLSTANNHTMDYGAAGALDTLTALDALHAEGMIKAHAGLGRNRDEAGRPQAVSIKGSRVLLSALGIVSGGLGHHRASATRPGQLAYQSAEDFEEAIRRLSEAEGDYRILSVHHGQERVVHTSPEAIRKFRREAVLGRGIDLVVGHHAHVVAGSEITNGRLILYGLGNFLHHGMQSSAHLGVCKDFGLMIRVHLLREDSGRLSARAVEAIALTDMHVRTARMPAAAGTDRMHVLNHLAAALDDPSSGSRGLRFTPRRDGTGLHCVAGAEHDPAPIGPMCQGVEPPPPVPVELRPRIIAACGNGAPPLLAVTEPRGADRTVRRGGPGSSVSAVSATSGFLSQ